MKISNWTTNVANQTYKDLDLPGFTRFVAKIYQLRITRFWGKILNSNFYLCKKFDISQLCAGAEYFLIKAGFRKNCKAISCFGFQ